MCFQDIRIYFRTHAVKVIKVGHSVKVGHGDFWIAITATPSVRLLSAMNVKRRILV